jgi:hypothetical protein
MITLPWPAQPLWPNRHQHWAKVHACRKAQKKWAARACEEAGVMSTSAAKVRLEISAYPPDRRRFDNDNLVASLKAAIDGIAEFLGVDDSKFEIGGVEKGGPIEHGQVVIGITIPA